MPSLSVGQHEGCARRQLVLEQGLPPHHPRHRERRAFDQASLHGLAPLPCAVELRERRRTWQLSVLQIKSSRQLRPRHARTRPTLGPCLVRTHHMRYQKTSSSMQPRHCRATSWLQRKFDTPTVYPGDCYPTGISDDKAQKLNRQYKAIREEYYTMSGYLPVTPENFHQWRQTTKAKRKTQFCEICSGSGRLSYIALLAGLSVAFPVDFRYGWNLGDTITSHQNLLLEAQNQMQPDVLIMLSPSCAPWSTSFVIRGL